MRYLHWLQRHRGIERRIEQKAQVALLPHEQARAAIRGAVDTQFTAAAFAPRLVRAKLVEGGVALEEDILALLARRRLLIREHPCTVLPPFTLTNRLAHLGVLAPGVRPDRFAELVTLNQRSYIVVCFACTRCGHLDPVPTATCRPAPLPDTAIHPE